MAGLDKLVNLRDLSLAHNRLTEIKGFGSLTQLQSLSLASNELGDLEQVSWSVSLDEGTPPSSLSPSS